MEPLFRDLYIANPVAEFELEPHQCLQLLKPLYGLCESGDLWFATMDKHHRLDLGMKALCSDPALYYLIRDGSLIGVAGSYVDDLLRNERDEFQNSVYRPVNGLNLNSI